MHLAAMTDRISFLVCFQEADVVVPGPLEHTESDLAQSSEVESSSSKMAVLVQLLLM